MNSFRCTSVLLFTLFLVGCSKKSDSDKSSVKDASQKEQGSGGATKGKSAGQSDTVTINTEQQRMAGVLVGQVDLQQVARSLEVVGQVGMDEQHTVHIGAIADGRITATYVLPGSNVRRGQTLAELHSHMIHETAGALAQAFAAVDRQRGAVTFAQQAKDRYRHLYSIQAASLEETQGADQQLVRATTELASAEASVRMEREHLAELLQVSPDSLTPGSLYNRELVPIRSVIDGTVITREVTPGMVVQTGTDTFVVSNLNTVWVTASLGERDLALVHVGANARVTTQAYPNQSFAGRITLVGDTLDPATRTVPVRIVVANPGVRLRPQMFASASIDQPLTRTAIFAPEDALQNVNGIQVVFVTTDGRSFRSQAVQIGTRAGHRIEVTNGLKAGDQIAVAGAFMVKSELLKGSMGEE